MSIVSRAAENPEAVAASKPAALTAPSPGPVVAQNLVSEEALQQVPGIAPGWDKHVLGSMYKSWVVSKGEMPRNPDAAFLGWVKKFTKGKRP